MQPRTLYALIAAGLLLPLGTVFAQSETPATSEPTMPETSTASEPYQEPTRLSLSPSELWLAPGESARIGVRIETTTERNFHVSVRSDLRTALSASEVFVTPDKPALLALKIQAPHRPSQETYPVVVTIDDGFGSGRAQEAIVTIHRPTPEPAQPQPVYPTERPERAVIVDRVSPDHAQPIRSPPRPACARAEEPIYGSPAQPAGPTFRVVEDGSDVTPTERRLAAMLDRIEKRLWRLEHAATSPRPCMMPDPVREPATIALGDADITVPERGARVAILLEGGDHGGRFRLGVHSRDDGWRYALEKDSIALGPHERTFVWLRVAPGETATSSYEVVASNGSTSLAAQGTASWAGPQIV